MSSDFRDWRGRTRELRERLEPARETARRFGGVLAEAFAGWWREGQVQAATKAALLFIAIAVAGIEADDYLAAAMNGHHEVAGASIWTKWIPLPIALVLLGAGLLRKTNWVHQPRVLAVMIGVAAIVAMRLWVALKAPLTDVALREVTDLFFAGLVCLTIWVTARSRPGLTLAVWVAALFVMLLARAGLWSIHFIFTPDLLPVVLSLVWSFVVLGGMSGRAAAAALPEDEQQDRRFGRWRIPEVFMTIVPAHVTALLLGGFLAVLCLLYTRVPEAGGGVAGSEAVHLLWTKSVAFGWGRAPLLRLARVMAEPMPLDMPIWMSTTGFLASYGIVGFAVLAFGSLLVLRMALGKMHDLRLSLASGPQMSLLAVQALIAMTLVGGPNSSIPPLLCGGWLGFAFAGRTRMEEQLAPPVLLPAFRRRRFIAGAFSAAVVLLIGALGTLGAMAPVLSRAVLASLSKVPLYDPAFRSRAFLAMDLNPWSPRAQLAMAAYLREQLDLSLNWDESLYQRIVSTYDHAMRLDPYDPLIALRRADVQLKAKRLDDAFATVLRSLEYNPSSPELISWTYLTASASESTNVAMAAVEQTLRISPAASRWWRERYRLDQKAGRGAQATTALNIALTAAMGSATSEEIEVVKASFERWQLGQQQMEEENGNELEGEGEAGEVKSE